MNSINVIFWEWVDNRGVGVMSREVPRLQLAQRAKLEERLDRLEQLESFTYESTKGYVANFRGDLKKIKIQGNVALRPILVFGPTNKTTEITFLLIAQEKDRELIPSNAQEIAEARLEEILDDENRRKPYDRN